MPSLAALTCSSSAGINPSMHNCQRFFEILGPHLQSLGQLVSQVTDGASSPMQTNAEELLRKIIDSNDRLDHTKTASATSCMKSRMMQKSVSAENTLSEIHVMEKGVVEKDTPISRCRLVTPLSIPIESSREEHSHCEYAADERTPLPKIVSLGECERIVSPKVPAEMMAVVPKMVHLAEPVEKSSPRPSKSNLSSVSEQPTVGICAVENEQRQRTARWSSISSTTSDGKISLLSDGKTSLVSNKSRRARLNEERFAGIRRVESEHRQRSSVFSTASSSISCHSRFSDATIAANEFTLEAAFLILDEQKTGTLDVDRIHHVVDHYHALCQEFTTAEAGEAIAAINTLHREHNRDYKARCVGMDFPTFSWLVTAKSLGKRITYHGFTSKDRGNMLIVAQALKAFCDQISITLESEGMDGTETWTNLDLTTQLDLLAKARRGHLHTKKTLETDSKSTRCSRVNFLPFEGSSASAKVARSVSVKEEVIVSVVILLSFVLVGISSDMGADAPPWNAIELGIKIFFLLEAVYKLKVYGVRTYFCGEDYGWNILDLMLVIISVVEFTLKVTIASSSSAPDEIWLLKLVRLSRLGRLIRLLRFPFFSEMRQILGGVLSGLRVLFWAIVLFLGFVYVVALAMSHAATKANDETLSEFRSVYWSLFTVFRCFTDDCAAADGTPLSVHAVRRFGPAVYIGYILTYLFMSLGLLNLIMAVHIEEVKNSAHRRRQVSLNVDRDEMESHLRSVIANMLEQDRYMRRATHENRDSWHRKAATLDDSFLDTFRRVILLKILKLVSSLRGVKAYKDPFSGYFGHLDKNGDLSKSCPDDQAITRDVFVKWLSRQDMRKVLDDLDVDCNAPVRLFDVLDADLSGVLEVDEIIEGIMNLRGPLQKCDVVAGWLSARALQKQLWDLQMQVSELAG